MLLHPEVIEKSTTLLEVLGGENTGQTPAPKIGETEKWIQGVTVYWSRDSLAETTLGTNAGVGK